RDLHSFPTRRSSDLITAKKPTASARISTRSSWSGHAKRCATTSSTWISAKDAATYASAHCTSLRCFRRDRKSVIHRLVHCAKRHDRVHGQRAQDSWPYTMRQPCGNFFQMLVTTKLPVLVFPFGPVRRDDSVCVVTTASTSSGNNSVGPDCV